MRLRHITLAASLGALLGATSCSKSDAPTTSGKQTEELDKKVIEIGVQEGYEASEVARSASMQSGVLGRTIFEADDLEIEASIIDEADGLRAGTAVVGSSTYKIEPLQGSGLKVLGVVWNTQTNRVHKVHQLWANNNGKFTIRIPDDRPVRVILYSRGSRGPWNGVTDPTTSLQEGDQLSSPNAIQANEVSGSFVSALWGQTDVIPAGTYVVNDVVMRDRAAKVRAQVSMSDPDLEIKSAWISSQPGQNQHRAININLLTGEIVGRTSAKADISLFSNDNNVDKVGKSMLTPYTFFHPLEEEVTIPISIQGIKYTRADGTTEVIRRNRPYNLTLPAVKYEPGHRYTLKFSLKIKS